jgi:transposase
VSRRRLPLKKIREILQYKYSHYLSNEKIAKALGIGKGSVHNVIERFNRCGLTWPLPSEMSDSTLDDALYPQEATSQKPLPNMAYLEKEIRLPNVTLQLLYEEYRKEHPDGLGRTAFYEYFSRFRSSKPDMKVIYKGGDILFIDFSGDGLEYIRKETGEIVDVELFVCSWGASSHSYAEGVESQCKEDFVHCHVHAFEYFKAVPNGLVPDNLKSAVTKNNRYDPTLNPLYRKMAEHYNTAIIPARPAKPQDKAVVESNVLHIQRYILARLRNRHFYSLREVNEAIWELLEEFNSRGMKDYGYQSRKQRFAELDQPYAKELPAKRFMVTDLQENVRVAPNYHIRYKDHYYSVPWEFVRKRVDVYQVGNIIEIYHDHTHMCRHLFSTRKYHYTTTTEHMPAEHRFVKGWSKSYFIFEAGKVGPATAEAVKVIMEKKDHVQQGFNAALGVLRFAKVYSPKRLEDASNRALHFKCCSYPAIKSILEQKLDKQTLGTSDNMEQCSLFHDNIRGADYYQTSPERNYHNA